MSEEMPEGLRNLAETEALKRKKNQAQKGEAADLDPDAGGDFVALLNSLDLFHTPDHRGYARVKVRDHLETWPLKSKDFERFLSRAYFTLKKRALTAQKLSDLIGSLEGRAQYDGETREIFTRLGALGEKLYLDLGDEAWQAVEIDADGYRVLREPPVIFRRKRGMRPLPIPQESTEIGRLRRFLNLESNEDWVLVLSFLVACLRPVGPYPILVLQGEQGCGKTVLTRMLRALIDPALTPLRSPPRCEQDLIIASSNSWVLAMDNLSGMKDWLSDALCRLTTGGGFSTRELYTNEEESLFDVNRPVIINGIDDLATRPDLLDRAIVLTLPVIDDSIRKSEKQLWQEFEDEKPSILGALLQAVSVALREVSSVSLPRKPRMADFAIWATAAERGLGLPPGAFMEAYAASSQDSMSSSLENNLVGQILLQVAVENAREHPWRGTMGELRSLMESKVNDKGRNWPASPQALGNQIRRIRPMLRKAGVDVQGPHKLPGGRRVFTVTYKEEVPNKSPMLPISPTQPSLSMRQSDLGNLGNIIQPSTQRVLDSVKEPNGGHSGVSATQQLSEASAGWMDIISSAEDPGAGPLQ